MTAERELDVTELMEGGWDHLLEQHAQGVELTEAIALASAAGKVTWLTAGGVRIAAIVPPLPAGVEDIRR